MQTMGRETIDMKVIRAFYANGIPFNVLRNLQFHEMVIAINNRRKWYKASRYERARTTLLDACKTSIETIEQLGGNQCPSSCHDNAKNCVAAQEIRKVHKHIFWSPCVVHTLNLIFKDLAENLIGLGALTKKGKSIVKFYLNYF
ncbi:hypothetical protein DVH24_031462 [Malus domestica]|uniref:Uncharacterized protein n=1 Tax=Malus domestica TaxID=3750 RepID=A0A498HDJ9_MALDO|nr:hypothetical protein DVH24_031462 [Malus domestica]